MAYKKTKLMLKVEADTGQPLEKLLPEMVNRIGLSATADQIKVSKAALSYWILKLGMRTHRVILGPGESVTINKANENTGDIKGKRRTRKHDG